MENLIFAVNVEFDNFEDVSKAKKQYESENKVILFIRDSHKLQGDSDIVKRCIYSRLCLHCKAGKERPTQSKGIRIQEKLFDEGDCNLIIFTWL